MSAVIADRECLPTNFDGEAIVPRFTVVLAVPRGEIASCAVAISAARSRGTDTITCEVSTDADGFDEAFRSIVDAVNHASRRFPAVPVVLVGHGAAAIPARAFADLCPESVSGVLMTQTQAA